MSNYKVLPGPEAFLPPSAASMGIVLPDPGEGLIEGRLVSEDEAIEAAAKKLLGAKVPTIFPGPQVLWNWNELAPKLAKSVRELAVALPARIIPMADYRPKYPKINPEVEINPNHPNLTIWHNKIDVCLFVGVHCHLSGMGLKMIRGSTDCYTIAFCLLAGHEDACISVRDTTDVTIGKLIVAINKLKSQGVKSQAIPFTQFTHDYKKK